MERRSKAMTATYAVTLVLVTSLAAAEPSPTADAFICPASARPANLSFTLKDLNGRDVHLADYAGRVILLDFWATWCGPCKIEIPWFVDLQARYGQEGLQVLGVSVDDTPDKLKPYAAEHKMNYPVLQGLGHDDLLEAFGPLDGLPTSFVISRQGAICATHVGLTGKNHFEDEIGALLEGRP
jgi:peroxiredoxin